MPLWGAAATGVAPTGTRRASDVAARQLQYTVASVAYNFFISLIRRILGRRKVVQFVAMYCYN